MDRADRFLYFPLVGLALAVAAALQPLGKLTKRPAMLTALILVGVAGWIGLGAVAARQVQTWRNSLTMWKHCVDLFPFNALANKAVGDHLADLQRFDLSIPYYERALSIDPNFTDTLNNYALRLATCHREELRDYEFAIGLAQRACELAKWENPRYRYVLSLACMNLATSKKREGEFELALEYYQKAIEADPTYEVPVFNLAVLLATCEDEELRKPDEAVRLAERACQLVEQPGALQWATLAQVYAETGRLDDAISTVSKALDQAHADGDSVLADELRQRLELYQTESSGRGSD